MRCREVERAFTMRIEECYNMMASVPEPMDEVSYSDYVEKTGIADCFKKGGAEFVDRVKLLLQEQLNRLQSVKTGCLFYLGHDEAEKPDCDKVSKNVGEILRVVVVLCVLAKLILRNDFVRELVTMYEMINRERRHYDDVVQDKYRDSICRIIDCINLSSGLS